MTHRPWGVFPWICLPAVVFCHLQPIRADWPQFLGPQRNGVSKEKTALTETVDDPDKRVLWRFKLGSGFAGPVVAGGKCIIHHRIDDHTLVDCLDAETGTPIWQHRHPTTYKDDFGFDNGPRVVPTIIDNDIFVLDANGILQNIDLLSGKQRWTMDLRVRYGTSKGFFGVAAAPVVYRKTVIVPCGAENKPTVRAFDRNSGDLMWETGIGESDYASPVVARVEKRDLGVFFVRSGILVVDLIDGRVVHEEPFRSPIHASVNAASPVVIGDQVFFSSCYDVGAGLWSFQPDDASLRNIWKQKDRLDCHYATPVAWNGHLYGYHGRQEQGAELRCIRVVDGAVVWKAPKIATGSVLLADGKLLVLTERGELIMAPASDSAFNPLYRIQVTGADTRALPALCQGRFYARDKRQLACIDLRK